jgi:hypothetical protein
MNTQAEIILSAIATLLAAGSIGASVERSREVAFEREDLPAVVVKPKDEAATPLANGLTRCELTVEIQIHTRGDVPDQLADPIAAAIHAVLTADLTLGGTCTRLFYTARAWEFSDSDGTGGQLTLHYVIHYLTPAGDITRLAV